MSASHTVRGTVKSLNYAPKGEVDALLVESDGGLVQVNLPHHLEDHARTLVGQPVAIHTKPEPKVADHPKGDHPVHAFDGFEGRDKDEEPTAKKVKAPGEPKPKGKPPGPEEVSGKVERINYAKHGEPNGVVLDSGKFVHLKPDGFKKAGLKVGDAVTAKGPGHGDAVDAETVNGVELGHPHKKH